MLVSVGKVNGHPRTTNSAGIDAFGAEAIVSKRITLIDTDVGEGKAEASDNACSQQLPT
jgi:hypothetical protein